MGNALLVLPFVAARLIWLASTYRWRRSGGNWRPPTGAVLPATGRVVDVRQGTEAAALSALFLYPVVWYRLARQAADLRAERAEQSFAARRRTSRWALLVAAVASVYTWPVMVLWRAWRVWRFIPGGAKNLALWMMVASALAEMSMLAVVATRPTDDDVAPILISAVILLTALGFGFLQELQNALVRTNGEAVSYGIVPAPLADRSFTPPPNWPAPPPGWRPPPGWQPGPEWELPDGWRMWSRDGSHGAKTGERPETGANANATR